MKKKVFPISMAVLWGIVYTNVLHSLALGICFGMLMGSVFGLFDSDKKDDHEQEMSCENDEGQAEGGRDVYKHCSK